MARLGDIATVITKGTTPTSIGFAFENDGINFVKIESVDENGNFICEKFDHISDECHEKLKRSQLQENDILFSIAGAIGRTAIVTKDILPANTNQALAIIRIPQDVINYSFLLYILQSSVVREQAEKKKQGVAQLNLSLKDIGDFIIPDIPLEEQQCIVDSLDKVSNLISLRKQQLSKLDELVKSRFVEMFGDVINNDRNWPMATMGDVAEIKIGPFGTLLHKEDYIVGGHALVNPSHIVDGKISVDISLTISDEKYEELSAYHLKIDDIVLGRRGEMGRCAVVKEEGLLCGTGSLIIRPNDRLKPYFLQTIISNPTYKKIIEDKAVGVTMMNLNVPIVESLRVPMLPIALQNDFISFMEQVDKSKFEIQKSLEKLETLKKALMQKYFG